MGGKGCGSAEANKHSWKSRTVTITKWRDRYVNAPKYGGKNDCTAATGLNKSTSTEDQEKDKRSCGISNCSGWSCAHCPGSKPSDLPTCANTWKCTWCFLGGWRWEPGGC